MICRGSRRWRRISQSGASLNTQTQSQELVKFLLSPSSMNHQDQARLLLCLQGVLDGFFRWMQHYQSSKTVWSVWTFMSTPSTAPSLSFCPSFFFRSTADIWTTSCHCVQKNRSECVCVCVWIWKVVIIAGVWPVYELFYHMNCVEGNLIGQLNNTTQKKHNFLVFKLDIISNFYNPW